MEVEWEKVVAFWRDACRADDGFGEEARAI